MKAKPVGTGRWVIDFTINSNLSFCLFPSFRNEISHINSFNPQGKYGKRSYEILNKEIVWFEEVGTDQPALKSTVGCALRENRSAEREMNCEPSWDHWSRKGSLLGISSSSVVSATPPGRDVKMTSRGNMNIL